MICLVCLQGLAVGRGSMHEQLLTATGLPNCCRLAAGVCWSLPACRIVLHP